MIKKNDVLHNLISCAKLYIEVNYPDNIYNSDEFNITAEDESSDNEKDDSTRPQLSEALPPPLIKSV